MAAFPTPPQPNTATVSPRSSLAVFTIAPNPAMIPQPTRPAASGRAAGSTLTAWPAATRQTSAKAPMPMAAVSGVPSSRVIFRWPAGRQRYMAPAQVGRASGPSSALISA
jgi:hypothetical protein